MKNFIFFFFLLAFARTGLSQSGCIQLDTCPAKPVIFCILSDNQTDLWNNDAFLTPVSHLHDLREGAVDLQIAAHSTCNVPLTISYRLWLDLDGDGAQETIVNSDSLPDYNSIHYFNLNGPGINANFDNRAVAPDQKYGFAKTDSTDGIHYRAFLRWNTQSTPNQYVVPQLPYGKHKICWVISDNLGNADTCQYFFEVKDCKAPEVVCLNGLSVNILPSLRTTLYATDFLQYGIDNASDPLHLQYGIRKTGTGSGFPVDSTGSPMDTISYYCGEIGTQYVDLWVRDEAGNTNSCQTAILVQDNLNLCLPGLKITCCVRNACNNSPMEGVGVELNAGAAFPPIYQMTDATGCAMFPSGWPMNTPFETSCSKDDEPFLYGLSTFDLLFIAKHILGISPLNPYQQIAADINRSGSISTFDIVELRKLLLGIYTELPNNVSWRFIDANYQFPNPNNAFQPPFPESITIMDNNSDSVSVNFIGIHIGDIDCFGKPGWSSADPRHQAKQLILEDHLLEAGTIMDIPLTLGQESQWLGFQFSIKYDPDKIQIRGLTPGSFRDANPDNFAILENCFNAAWVSPISDKFESGQNLLNLKVQVMKPCWLHEVFQISPDGMQSFGITPDESAENLALAFLQTNRGSGLAPTLRVAPNPTAHETQLTLELPEDQSITLELFDQMGKLCWQKKCTLLKGFQTLEIPEQAMAQNGIYYWRVVLQSGQLQGKIIKE